MKERLLGAGSFEVQTLSGDIVHSSLQVRDAGVEGVGGEARSSNTGPVLQLLMAGQKPCAHGKHVSWVGWQRWLGGQTVDVNSTDADCCACGAEPLTDVRPSHHNRSVGIGQ